MPTEIDIYGRSCDVVKHGSPLAIILSRSLLNVLISTLSQIIANLTRENLAGRAAEIRNLPWTQTEKDCVSQMQSWTTSLAYQKKKQCFVSVLSLMKKVTPWKTKMNQGEGRLCEYWGSIFRARVEGPGHHQYENILRYVQKAPDDIHWTLIVPILMNSCP